MISISNTSNFTYSGNQTMEPRVDNILTGKSAFCTGHWQILLPAACDWCRRWHRSFFIVKLRNGWKFWKIILLLIMREFSLYRKDRQYVSCTRNAMFYGSETCGVTEDVKRLEHTERSTTRCMCNATVRWLIKWKAESKLGTESFSEIMKTNRLLWSGYVERKDGSD